MPQLSTGTRMWQNIESTPLGNRRGGRGRPPLFHTLPKNSGSVKLKAGLLNSLKKKNPKNAQFSDAQANGRPLRPNLRVVSGVRYRLQPLLFQADTFLTGITQEEEFQNETAIGRGVLVSAEAATVLLVAECS